MNYLTKPLLAIGAFLCLSISWASDDPAFPDVCKEADSNHNGIVEPLEVEKAIEGFLTGNPTWNEDSICQLIEICLETH